MNDLEFYMHLTRLLESIRNVRPIVATVLLREVEMRMAGLPPFRRDTGRSVVRKTRDFRR